MRSTGDYCSDRQVYRKTANIGRWDARSVSHISVVLVGGRVELLLGLNDPLLEVLWLVEVPEQAHGERHVHAHLEDL